MNISMGTVELSLSSIKDKKNNNHETLQKSTPQLIEYYAKGHKIGFQQTKADLASRETELVEKLHAITIPRVAEAKTDDEVISLTKEVVATYPEAKEVIGNIRDTFGGGGTGTGGGGIQALGVFGVMVLIFLVGVAHGVSNKKKQQPK